MPNAALNPSTRATAIDQLRDAEVDVLVIGGGVTGAGAALDAATRGLKVALVERRDWAAGTSSRSGKLFHGGLRYLEQFNFGLVREALKERGLMLQRLCPHLVRPIRFVYPLHHRVWERAYMGAGLALYDTLGGAGAVPRHRHLSRSAVGALAPGMKKDALVGALTFYDAQVDDARHTMELVRTAASHGAVVANAVEVADLTMNDGRVTGARLRDTLTGEEFEVRARAVINATGVWTDAIRAMAPGGNPSFEVKASKGVHLMIPRDKIDSTVSMFIRAEDSVLFVREWFGHWLVGTTDTAYDEQLDHPAATRKDVDYLLRNLNTILVTPLTVDDVDGVFAGLRPLVKGKEGATSALSREHAVETSPPGLTSVAGGKYTTYRVMAQDVVDAATQDLDGAVDPSSTEHVRLLGAVGLEQAKARLAREASTYGFDAARIEHLTRRYGALVGELEQLIADQPDLAEPIAGAPKYLRAEAVYAVTHEGALHIDDVLTRRTHIAIETPDRGVAAATEVADLIAGPLGWDEAEKAHQVEHYRQRVAAELAAQQVPDEHEASQLRTAVSDPRVRIG
ncbi:MAG: glycerol-3-phosphate dehydrogenase/oxidase [Actinomycetales bacterium]